MNRTKSRSAEVAVTGDLWGGHEGRRSIGAVLLELLDASRNELILVAYRLSSAAPELFDAIERALARGCAMTIVLDYSELPHESVASKFSKLLKAYPALHIFCFIDRGERTRQLHAKMLISDRKRAVVGSANFSRNGFVDNHEIALLVFDQAAEELASASDRLIDQGEKSGILRQLSAQGT